MGYSTGEAGRHPGPAPTSPSPSASIGLRRPLDCFPCTDSGCDSPAGPSPSSLTPAHARCSSPWRAPVSPRARPPSAEALRACSTSRPSTAPSRWRWTRSCRASLGVSPTRTVRRARAPIGSSFRRLRLWRRRSTGTSGTAARSLPWSRSRSTTQGRRSRATRPTGGGCGSGTRATGRALGAPCLASTSRRWEATGPPITSGTGPRTRTTGACCARASSCRRGSSAPGCT